MQTQVVWRYLKTIWALKHDRTKNCAEMYEKIQIKIKTCESGLAFHSAHCKICYIAVLGCSRYRGSFCPLSYRWSISTVKRFFFNIHNYSYGEEWRTFRHSVDSSNTTRNLHIKHLLVVGISAITGQTVFTTCRTPGHIYLLFAMLSCTCASV